MLLQGYEVHTIGSIKVRTELASLVFTVISVVLDARFVAAPAPVEQPRQVEAPGHRNV